ncbi:hypothetical protein Q1M63_24520 [Sinorhizobium meliloti]|nr:hypothetical protein Q1M63_24520 [Sinorhizobium meliloti]
MKAIGAVMGLSNAAVISAMIREKIAAGVIPNAIPGIVIRKVSAGVGISLNVGREQTFSDDGARALAYAIRGVVAGDTSPTMINMDHNFMVQKQGTGFKIAIPFGSEGIAFPPDLALDLADLIEKAAE